MPERTVCLDVTRLARRIGRGPHTGIDRVEYAYLRGLLSRERPLFGLGRTAAGYVLLDRRGLQAFAERVDGTEPLGPPDAIARLSLRLDDTGRRVQADLRRLAIGRAPPPLLRAMLARRLPGPVAYLNVGHSSLSDRVLSAFRALPGGRVLVFLHDTIPFEFPDFQRPGGARAFDRKLQVVSRHADEVVAPSYAAAGEIRRHLAAHGRTPPVRVVRLGLAPPAPDPVALGRLGLDLAAPYFVAVGTIEPRKNLDLLFHVWSRLEEEGPAPRLFVAGARGWAGHGWHDRTDRAFQRLASVTEVPAPGDGALAALVEGAAALLQPSRAEGFGIPPHEAALRGVPVIATDLPVYRETLGDIPVYLPPDEMYQWKNAVAEALRGDNEKTRAGGRWAVEPAELTWDRHLASILALTD